MGRPNKPRRGSLAYSPRKRSESPVARFASWPEIQGEPKIQGFAGYKAGMTHAVIIDYRKHSTTAGQEVSVPVTVIEVPPMKIAAVRFYKDSPYGLQASTEIWADNLDEELGRKIPLSEEKKKPDFSQIKPENVDEVRVLAYTQPKAVTGVPKKKPELMELRIGGGDIKKRIEYAKKILGNEVKINDFTKEGQMVDVAAVTKGKGFQGHIKRWGVKLLFHKNSKHRRMIGTLGPHFPSYVTFRVPQAGQMGYHQRTEYNKRILKIGEDGKEITPSGGFLNYGIVRNGYVLIHGSVPGPVKRLVRLRDPVRKSKPVEKVDIVYVSTESKQGA